MVIHMPCIGQWILRGGRWWWWHWISLILTQKIELRFLFISQQDSHSLAPTSRTIISLESEQNSSVIANHHHHYNNVINYNNNNNNNISDHNNLDEHLQGENKRIDETQSPLQAYSAAAVHPHHPQHYGFVHPALSHSLHDDYYSDYNRLNIHHHHHHHQSTMHKEHVSWNIEDPNCDTSINNLRSKYCYFNF